ncbi:MAG TPA: calcium-binding protein, partial [Rhodobacteraceae bacterium]|nr:calcium-binding protein [Paracoccaceae bacterium]
GGTNRDVLIGNDGINYLQGEGGRDILKGNGGNDLLRGGDKKDVLTGGTGDDILDGGNGKDFADYRKASSAINVDMAANQVTGTASGTDMLISIERINGTRFDDTMVAGDSTVLFLGGGGVDTLTGGSARDRLQGGKGKDVLSGNDQRDVLIGNAGMDILKGGKGADTLIGGAGRDGMRGGLGDDTFVYLKLSDTGPKRADFDLIKGFQTGDLIDLSRLDALTGGGDDAFSYRGTGRFTGAGGEIKVVEKGKKTFVVADIDGDKQIDFGIEFWHATIDVGDFIL